MLDKKKKKKKAVLLIISLANSQFLLKQPMCTHSTVRGVVPPCSVGSKPRSLAPLVGTVSEEFTEFLNLNETHSNLPIYLYPFAHTSLCLVCLSEQCNLMSKYCTTACLGFFFPQCLVSSF